MNSLLSRVAGRGLWVVIAGVVLAAVLGHNLMRGMNHDEHPYIAVAYLLDSGRLYRDFGYNHMPYLPFVFRAVHQASPETTLFLAGRLLTVGFIATAALSLAYAVAVLGRSRWLGLAALGLFALNSLILRSDTVPIKDFAAMAATLAAIAVIVQTSRRATWGRWQLVLAGVLAGSAIGFKLPYLVFVFPLALGLARAETSDLRGWSLRLVWPFAAGVALGILPLVALAAPYPDVFWFCNWQYHQLYGEIFFRSGVPDHGGRELSAKLTYAFRLAIHDFSVMGLAASTLLLAVIYAIHRLTASTKPRAAWDAMLAGTAFLAAVAIAMAPAPSWPHHYSVIVPFAILVGTVGYARLEGAYRFLGVACFAVAMGATLAQNGAYAYAMNNALNAPARWVTSTIARDGAAVRAYLGPPTAGDRIATLVPVYALSAGYGIYPELATGPFFFGTGNLVPLERHARYKLTSPDQVAALLAQNPPRGIITGLERLTPENRNLDLPLETFAREHGYQERELPGTRLTVFRRP